MDSLSYIQMRTGQKLISEATVHTTPSFYEKEGTEAFNWVDAANVFNKNQKLISEATVHTMQSFYEKEETEAFNWVDGANVYNNINRKALFHSKKILCPFVSTYLLNCYGIPTR